MIPVRATATLTTIQESSRLIDGMVQGVVVTSQFHALSTINCYKQGPPSRSQFHLENVDTLSGKKPLTQLQPTMS